VYTVDQGSGDLQETYLAVIGGPWVTQDLSAMAHTPPVAAGTSPVAILHDGYVSVYTVDAGSGDLQETYLAVLGGPWVTQDLSKNYGTPAVAAGTSPTAVFHDGYTSVYTVDANNSGHDYGDLQETYLPAIGDRWATQDLTAKYSLPTALDGASPVALYHTGYTSVYYTDGQTGHLDEDYLPAISDPWSWNDLSGNYHTPDPLVQVPPSPLVHYAANGGLTWTSVYTVDTPPAADPIAEDIQETYLPAIGPGWTTQNLTTQRPDTPPW
jgi:hypothetical protein